MEENKNRIIIGMTGASGIPVGIEILRATQYAQGWQSILVLTNSAVRTLGYESSLSLRQLENMADEVYDISDIGAPIASGSYGVRGMIIAPCSMKTVAGISCGYADNLILRAADVTIKERRPLVLMVRECPLSAIHLKNMLWLSEIGADIYPLVMTFYNKPETVLDMTSHLAARALARFGIDTGGLKPWKG